KGTADIHVAFEMMESLRYLPYMKKKGMIVLNTQKIPPLSVSAGYEIYPTNIVDQLLDRGLEVYTVNALEIARSVRELRTVNMVMTGALSRFLPVDESILRETIRERLKERFIEVNLEAFNRGREIIDHKEKQTSGAA
ncbi:MAG: 2-oxoacid:acceptor oxidoreductase family protein, partial [Thermodesulfovibrionales bacterium]